MNKQVSSTIITIVIGAMMILLLEGCATTSLTQISAFGKATASLADDAKKAFELIDSSTIDRKMYDVAANKSLAPKDVTFEGLFKESDSVKYQIRIAVLEKLGNYAKALDNLATADFRKDIDAASTDLYGSLSGLSATYKKVTDTDLPLKDDQLKLIATAVDAIGTVIVETKRRDAIKTIIIQTDEAVQNAAKLLEVEFGKDSELSKFVHENLTDADGSLRTAYNIQKKSPNSTFNLRYEMLVKIRQMYNAAQTSPMLFDNISAGAKKVREAHATLKTAVMKDEFSSAEIAKQIGELVTFAKSVHSYYEKLGSKN
ncbi:MAG: hypothetical protein A2031_05920 [Deltaproteobacteria bacterium RBG_19FT_COMBO_43_11]|nr:MAG: hypothetical protein A2W27_07060 [Deltaproteobacteria bacterium RBG_16_44_11]OGP91119.1 MAG: hypothetical protein A2031_05920 [Deltaproteobacteria bacterium RBG_19FT_COMBO_43_11]